MKLQSKNIRCNFYANFGSQYSISRQLHPISEFNSIVELSFEGKMFFSPSEYTNVLKRIYGLNYMELPPVEKRVTHNPKYIKFSDGEEVIFDEEV